MMGSARAQKEAEAARHNVLEQIAPDRQALIWNGNCRKPALKCSAQLWNLDGSNGRRTCRSWRKRAAWKLTASPPSSGWTSGGSPTTGRSQIWSRRRTKRRTNRMEPSRAAPNCNPSPEDDPQSRPAVPLRLYVARSTPNSVRAEQNLFEVLDDLRAVLPHPALEIVNVFAQPKRAITDNIVVTPTLIGLAHGTKIVLMGDLADRIYLECVLLDLFEHDKGLQPFPTFRG